MEAIVIAGLFILMALPFIIGGFVDEFILPKFPKLMRWIDKMVDKL